MRKLFTVLATILLTASVFAQSPEKMSYQAVVRNNSDQLVTNYSVGMRVSILQGSGTGTEVYKEIYNPNPQTNANGLVTIEIGGGIPLIGTFATIDWALGPFFIKTETDPTGGTNYTITGTSQLLSVPYALHSKRAENGITTAQAEAIIANTAKTSYPSADATKLAGIATGAEVNIQADWNQSTTTADDYIKNKPTIPDLKIGQSYQGGIIFWLDATGQHGLIAATADQSTGIQWYNGSNTGTNSVRNGIAAGKNNTERIISNQGVGAYAAQLCANYQNGGYGDWYLPSRYELNLLYEQKTAVGDFASAYYWSSTEGQNTTAWVQWFGGGFTQNTPPKNSTYYVRAVRDF